MAQLSENTSVTISPVKESLRDRPTDKSRVQKRNSKVELLRIIGIVLILLNHGLQDDLLPASTLPWSIFSNLFSRLGGVGDVLFFGITAYYLCQKERASSIRSGLRRIWLLERQLLFYSIGLFLLTLILWSKGIGFQTYSSDGMIALGIRSVMPLASAFWWYPTSYAVFLLAQPFLDYLLQCGGKRFHGALAGLLFVIFSVQVPRVPLLLNWTPALFVYQYIVFSYVIRHCNLKKNALVLLVLASALCGLTGPVIAGITGSDVSAGYLNLPQSMPAMVFGFSLVLLATSSKPSHNKLINLVASCSFAAYLIFIYPSMRLFFSKAMAMAIDFAGSDICLRFGLEVGIALSAFAIALVVDSIRQAIFQCTCDRHRGAWFDCLWESVTRNFFETGESKI